MTTVIQHLDAIEHHELVLPEFQREYVWKLEQAKQLMVSLSRGYPTGSLLFWETSTPPDIKGKPLPANFVGRVRVLLDGQQRLTTLYLLIKGEIPPYYTAEDVHSDPRKLYFHLVTREFEYYGPVKMGKDPLWISVVDFYRGNRPNIFVLAKELNQGEDEMLFAQKLNDSVVLLDTIKQREYPVQLVPGDADIDDAIDVFDRVNSLGTRLTEAELALTHMTGKWPDIRRIFKQKLAQLESQSFRFSLEFLVRCMTGVVTRGAQYERIHKATRLELEAGWARLDLVLNTTVALLKGRAHIYGTDDLSTLNALVPIVVYLAHHGGCFASDREMRLMLYWMYQALLWQRYSNRVDENLEKDLGYILNHERPVKALLNEIINTRGRLDLRPADLEGRGIDHPAFRIMLVAAKAREAVDWFTGIPLAGNSSISNGETYRVFPQDLLFASGRYDPANHMHRKLANEIGNRIALEKATSAATPPEQLLPMVVERYPDALAQQFVPSDPELWRVENFEKFLALRREMIANGVNSYLASLIDERIPAKVFPQITKLPEGKTATLARQAVDKLTIDEVDIGLFMLGRLFEEVLRDFIQAAGASGRYPVGPNTCDKLAYMIDWTKSHGIISDPSAPHFLRQERNLRAHGATPSLAERQTMLNTADLVAGMYLDYILFFTTEREKLH